MSVTKAKGVSPLLSEALTSAPLASNNSYYLSPFQDFGQRVPSDQRLLVFSLVSGRHLSPEYMTLQVPNLPPRLGE
jgi:hypothetical protein